MEKNDHRDIWVFLEEFEGKPKQVGAELLGQARRLADEIGQEVAAVIIAHDADEALEMARRYGADRAYVIEGECYRHFTADSYAEAFSYLCEKYQPEIILVGATANGRELASHVAVKLEAGLTADCTALYIDPETAVMQWERPAFGGNLYARISANTHPQMGTVRPGAMPLPEPTPHQNMEMIREDFIPQQVRVRVKHFIKDMKIICEEAAARGESLPMVESVLKVYEEFAAAGITDEPKRSELLAAFDESRVVFRGEALEVFYPEGTVPSEETALILGLDYTDEIKALLQPRALPRNAG